MKSSHCSWTLPSNLASRKLTRRHPEVVVVLWEYGNLVWCWHLQHVPPPATVFWWWLLFWRLQPPNKVSFKVLLTSSFHFTFDFYIRVILWYRMSTNPAIKQGLPIKAHRIALASVAPTSTFLVISPVLGPLPLLSALRGFLLVACCRCCRLRLWISCKASKFCTQWNCRTCLHFLRRLLLNASVTAMVQAICWGAVWICL